MSPLTEGGDLKTMRWVSTPSSAVPRVEIPKPPMVNFLVLWMTSKTEPLEKLSLYVARARAIARSVVSI